jgi:hypothetical protein
MNSFQQRFGKQRKKDKINNFINDQHIFDVNVCDAYLLYLLILTKLCVFDVDVGVGVHACGFLSDMIQYKCFLYQAAYVLAPCCIGKVKVTKT